jgi:OmcA/MtrC family decaheme c-type cytochrome
MRMIIVRRMAIGLCALALVGSAGAVTIPGGGAKRIDCHVEVMTNGVGYPAGGVFKGSTCADGDVCDADGTRNGSCLFTPMICLNVADPAIPTCSVAEISGVTFKGKIGKSSLDTSGFDAAVAALGLPVSSSVCTAPVDFAVPVGGPDKKGDFVKTTAQLQAKGKTTKGTDKDKFKFVCLPGVGPQVTTSSTTSSTTTTSTTGTGPTTSSTTTSTLPAGTPGAGLQTSITGVTLASDGTIVVTFRLTDSAGVAITPSTAASAATNPNQARVRMTLARIDVEPQTAEGFTTTFTRYENLILNATTHVPSYDTTGAFALVDAATGTWTYTFGRKLPPGFPTDLTHTVGAQIQRTFAGEGLVANPTFNFVPNGSAVTTVREDVTTADCNTCHNPLQAHGTGRREVKLCVLCHTSQTPDPDTGNSIDFKQMVHRIHMGKDIPSVVDGPVGTQSGISNAVFGEKVKACVNGPFPTKPCTVDADCGAGGTCSGTTTVGVAFPQDIRNCAKCHAHGATVTNHLMLPSALTCTGCHDDVNPGETTLNGLAPGTGHVPGPQPDAFCRICHKDQADAEFDITIPGAHVIPTRSATLAGLQAEIVAASGTPSNPVQVQFRLKDGAGTALTSFTGFNRIAFAISGPTTDFGGSSAPLIAPTAFGGGATGTLTGPDGTGLATYTTATNLPADATGTWRVGIEARRAVTVNGQTVNEAPQNVVADFSVDGSPVKARRTVVTAENCASCHGTFSKDFSIHGNLRNRPEYCVVCHNARVNDFARRKPQIVNGADPMNETIAFKHLIHKIHRGEELEHQPYIVYGFGGGADFGDVRFPGDLRDCDTCHTGDSQLLPLPAGLLPTNVSVINAGNEQVIGTTPPIQDACLACHDSDAAAAHAETNTTGSGAEACAVCHGEGAVEAVSAVHARP